MEDSDDELRKRLRSSEEVSEMRRLIRAVRRQWCWVPIDNIWLSRDCVEWLNEKVHAEIYPSKSDLMEALVREAMKKEEAQNSKTSR